MISSKLMIYLCFDTRKYTLYCCFWSSFEHFTKKQWYAIKGLSRVQVLCFSWLRKTSCLCVVEL